MGQRQGIQIETGDGNIKTVVFGWGAVALGIGIAVSSIILSSWLGVALTILASCLGASLVCVGIGEGIRRARYGRAVEIAASRGLLPESEIMDALPWERR